MIGTLVLCMACLCICIIVLNHKLNNLRRDFEEEFSRERTVRNIAVNEERCTRIRTGCVATEATASPPAVLTLAALRVEHSSISRRLTAMRKQLKELRQRVHYLERRVRLIEDEGTLAGDIRKASWRQGDKK